MDKDLDKILRDIYALDATLKERDAEVRAVVSVLIDAHPKVPIDFDFIQNLRMRVLSSNIKPATPSPYAENVRWWLVRVAPVGAVAVLLLMLIETPRSPVPTSLEDLPRTESAIPTTEDMLYNSPIEDTSSFSMMAPADDSTRTMGKQGAASVPYIEVLPVHNAMPYVQLFATLTTDGYVVVYDSSEAIVGTSSLLSAKEMRQVTVPLSRTLVEGETLSARMFVDDGDGFFETKKDGLIAVPETGLTYTVAFTVEAEYLVQ